MEKTLVIILIFMCFLSVNALAENNNSEKDEEIIAGLERQLSTINDSIQKYEKILNRISNRQFPRKISESELAKALKPMSIKEICENRNDIHKKIELAKDTKLSKDYSLIIEIKNSLREIYNEDSIKKYIKLVKNINPLEEHKDDFKKLSSDIKNYRFMMFELADVINSIHSIEGDKTKEEIKEILTDKGDLKYIEKEDFPYIYNCVDEYIENWIDGKVSDCEDILEDLRNACPDAFSEIELPRPKEDQGSSISGKFK